MRTRLNLACILGFVILIFKPSLVLTAAMLVLERPSIQEVEEYVVNAVKNINKVVESILAVPIEECAYEGVLNPWNQFLKQVSQHFYILNAIAGSDLPCNVTAYQAI